MGQNMALVLFSRELISSNELASHDQLYAAGFIRVLKCTCHREKFMWIIHKNTNTLYVLGIIVAVRLECQVPVTRLRIREVHVVVLYIRRVQLQFVVINTIRSVIIQGNAASLETRNDSNVLVRDILQQYHDRSQSLGSTFLETPLWHQQFALNNKKSYQHCVTRYVILNFGGGFYIHTSAFGVGVFKYRHLD